MLLTQNNHPPDPNALQPKTLCFGRIQAQCLRVCVDQFQIQTEEVCINKCYLMIIKCLTGLWTGKNPQSQGFQSRHFLHDISTPETQVMKASTL